MEVLKTRLESVKLFPKFALNEGLVNVEVIRCCVPLNALELCIELEAA